MAVGDLSFQNITSSGSTYQPSGSTVYKILWCGIGGQASNTAMVTDGTKEVILWKNDGSVTWYNGVANGSEISEDFENSQKTFLASSSVTVVKIFPTQLMCLKASTTSSENLEIVPS